MTESLQEIERLVNQCGAAIDSYIGEGSECDILMAAITRVVQESEKQVEIVKSLHRETREELYAKELLVAERDARIAELEKALREYGKHKSGCYDKRQVVPRCVCGLNSALASRDAP